MPCMHGEYAPDININLMEKSIETVDYLLMLQSSSFFSVLNKPTL